MKYILILQMEKDYMDISKKKQIIGIAVFVLVIICRRTPLSTHTSTAACRVGDPSGHGKKLSNEPAFGR